jgi:peroxiredoxin
MIKIFATLLLSVFLFNSPIDQAGYSIGDKAIDFNLKNVDGTSISMGANTSNKGYIINFTCNTCPYSVAYQDRIIALHKKFSPQGYPVIAINPNDPIIQPADSFKKMQQRAKEKAFPFPYVIDSTQEITLAYGATNTPHVYVVEKVKQDYIVRYIGAIDNNSRDASLATKLYVEDAVNSLLQRKSIETTSTKAIGCTIKWSAASKEKRAEL